MKRRRINKTALHREVGLLERALATFTDDFELRLSRVKNMTFYNAEKQGGAAGRREDKQPRRQQRGGQRVQRRKRREVAFIESGVEDVKPTHPNPELHPTATLNEQDTGRQVAAVGRRGNKCRRWRKRGEWPDSKRKAGAQEDSEAGEAGVAQRDVARMRAQVEVAERERRLERQEETDRLNRLEQKLIQTQTELQTERTEKEQTDKQLQTALTENAQLHTQMTELIDQITEITEATRAQTETDHFCTAGLKQKLAAEQDRVATAQIQIELSTEMNEQLQLQVTDLTTAVEQLRDRPTEHARKQTDTPTVTAVQKAAAPQKAAAVKKTRVLPRAAAVRQVAPNSKKAPAQKKTEGKSRIQGAPRRSQGCLETQRLERFRVWRMRVRIGMQVFIDDLSPRFDDEDHFFNKVLKGWFWDVFDTDEDAVVDASATAKHVRVLFQHPIVQNMVNCENGQSSLLLLEAIEALLETEEGIGSQGEKGVVKVLRL